MEYDYIFTSFDNFKENLKLPFLTTFSLKLMI